MDISYLLLLQEFREGVGAFLAPFLDWVSKFAVSFVPIAFACIVYWCFDRKAGKRILAGFGLGMLANGFLKLVFCVYRPWIRDSRVEPYGDSKVAATGYSFPSGHSTWATALFGGIGLWVRKFSKFLCFVFIFLLVSTLFSRNYLGVHTPQDVIVGFLATACMMFIAKKIEDWTDEKPERDKVVLVAGILLCAVLVAFYTLKSYPLTYLDDGSLLVDPKKMQADSFEGIGFISAYVICRYFERRGPAFDTEFSQKERVIIGILALIPLFLWMQICYPGIMEINRSFGRFAGQAGMVIYIFVIAPWIMHLICKMKK